MARSLPFLIALVALHSAQLIAQVPTHQSIVHNQVGSSSSVVSGVATDPSGNLVITGWRSDVLDFGGTVHPAGTGAIFLAKFDAQGNEIWSKVSGSADVQGNHKGMSVAVDADGNIYDAGWVFAAEQAVFDGTTLPAGTLGFVAKYSSVGVLSWVKDFGSNVNAIAVDHAGYPFINLGDASIHKLDPANGNSLASAAGNGDLQNVLYHNIVINDNNDVFAQWGNRIARYDNNLVEAWSTPLNKPFGAESYRISIDFLGNIWASFYALFGTVTLGGTDYTSFPAGYIYQLSGTAGAVLSCTSPGAFKLKKIIRGGIDELYVRGDYAFNTPNVVKYDLALNPSWSVPTFDTKDIALTGADCFVLGGAHTTDITLDGTTYARPNGSGQDNAIAGYLCAADVGMEETVSPSGLVLFPVPANDQVSLSHAATGPIIVYTAQGAVVLTKRWNSTERLLSVQELAPGAYVLRDSEGRSARLMIER